MLSQSKGPRHPLVIHLGFYYHALDNDFYLISFNRYQFNSDFARIILATAFKLNMLRFVGKDRTTVQAAQALRRYF